MRIRVGVLVGLCAAGRGRKGGNEVEEDSNTFRSTGWWTSCIEGSRLQEGSTNCHSSTAAAGAGARGRTSAAEKAFPPSVTAAGQTTPAAEQSCTGPGSRRLWRECNVWHHVGEFWYFADGRSMPTMGILKIRLLECLLQGVSALQPGVAAGVARLAREYLCQQQQSSPHLCDFLRHAVKFPTRCSTSAQAILQLQGALLPDDQPLDLLERGDYVELCITTSSPSPGTASGPAALKAPYEAYECLKCSRPFSLSSDTANDLSGAVHELPFPLASHNDGSVLQRSSLAEFCGIGMCTCWTAGCASGRDQQRKEVLRKQRRAHSGSADAVQQHYTGKRPKVYEAHPDSSCACMPCLEREGGEEHVPLSRVATSANSSASAREAIPTAVTPKNVKRATYPKCASVTRTGAPVGVSTLHKRGRCSNSYSGTTSSSSRSSTDEGCSAGESRKENDRDNRRHRLHKKGSGARKDEDAVSLVNSQSRAAYIFQDVRKDFAVTSVLSAGKSPAIGSSQPGDALARAKKIRKCLFSKRFPNKKNASKGKPASAESAQQSKPAAPSKSKPGASVRTIRPDERRSSPVAPAAAGSLVVSIRESTSGEEKSGSEEDSPKQKFPATDKREPVSSALPASETPEVSSTKLNKQQPQLAAKKVLASIPCTRESSSEESSTSVTSSEDSTSSSSEDDEGFDVGKNARAIRNIRGRMPAAVAQAAGALRSRGAVSTQRNEKETESNQEWRVSKSLAASGAEGSPPHSKSDQVSLRRKTVTGYSQTRTPTKDSTACAEARSGTVGADRSNKGMSLEEHGRSTVEKCSSRQQQEEKARQRQDHQDKPQQPIQPQAGQEQSKEPSWQLLSFKPWADPSLTAVQPGQWLRVRLLHLVGGMPTLDAWKTVCVEATDVRAERIKLWELIQGAQSKRHDRGSGEDGSNDGSSGIGQQDQPSEEGSVIRVPRGNVRGKQRRGTSRWVDWAELACICTAAAAEEDLAGNVAIAKTGVAPAGAFASESLATNLPAGAMAPGAAGDKVDLTVSACSTNLEGTDAFGRLTAKSTGLKGAQESAAEAPQRAAAPFRYLPRRLLSLQHQTPSNSEHTGAGEEAAATSEGGVSQNSSTDNAKEAVGSLRENSRKPALLAANRGSTVLQTDNSVTLLYKETVGRGTMTGCTDIASSDSSLEQKTNVGCQGDDCGNSTHVALPPGTGREIDVEPSSCVKKNRPSNEAVSGRDASPSVAVAVSESSVAAVVAGEKGPKQGNMVGGNKLLGTRAEASAAGREEEWEAFISSKLEIYLDEDGEAVLASHPAAPTASFHLPLPRELIVECCKRLKGAHRARKDAQTRHTHRVASGASTNSDGQGDAISSEPPASVTGAETGILPEQVLCTEKDPSPQVSLGECGIKINGDAGEDTAGSNNHVLAEENSANNCKQIRIIAADDWKGFECVKACARRVVGEQLQHIRRALRRQVDYYFSPENWQRDVYLRSRAVPLSSTCDNSSCPSSGSDRIFTNCVAEDAPPRAQGNERTGASLATAEDSRQIVMSSPAAVSPRCKRAEAQGLKTGAEAADVEDLAVNLDDIMVFPRMRALTRDRDFVAWCIKAGGGLHHVRLESRGELYWLVIKKNSESRRQGRAAMKGARRS